MYQQKAIRADKGKEGGSCNVTHCQDPYTAFCYNTPMRAYYCIRCARKLNDVARMDKVEPFVNIPENYHELYENAIMAAENKDVIND